MTNASSASPQGGPGETWYVLAQGNDAPGVVERLSARFRVRTGPVHEDALVYLDTPDWRIHLSGRELARRERPGGGEGVLELSNGVGSVGRAPLERRPDFVWDLPEGALRKTLEPVVKVRRLLPQVEMTTRSTCLDVLDEREKTVVRLSLEDASLAGASPATDGAPGPLTGTVCVTSLRGYEREREEIASFLEAELGLAPVEELGLVRTLAAIGRDPAREVPVWRVQLERGEPAGRALRRVLLRLLEVMEANEEGLVADVDTEFLHDFRVAVRRTRSILGELKKILPPAERKHFRGEFAWLGKLTTSVRDLDVFLLQARRRPAFRPLEDYLRGERERSRARMIEGLRTERYAALRRDWRTFLEAPRHGADPAKADKPIEKVSSRAIRKLHEGILARAAVMDADTRPAELHELRIECKKLRYMVDAFGCLFAQEHVAYLLQALKRLQDVLGDYNDLAVQQARLYGFAAELPSAKPEALLALGGIVERLRQKAERTRPKIVKRLREFASNEDAGRMKELLSSSSS